MLIFMNSKLTNYDDWQRQAKKKFSKRSKPFRYEFLIFFMKIENIVYASFQNSMLFFINGFSLVIMTIQSNQSPEFE